MTDTIPDTVPYHDPPTFTEAPMLFGRAFANIEKHELPDHVLRHWFLSFGVLEIYLHEWRDGSWNSSYGNTSFWCDTLEECLADLERSLLSVRNELPPTPIDDHAQAGIDAYALHLGKQAAGGVILEHETKWLDEYDRRRTHR